MHQVKKFIFSRNKNINYLKFSEKIDCLTYGTSLFFSSFCIYKSYIFYKNKN